MRPGTHTVASLLIVLRAWGTPMPASAQDAAVSGTVTDGWGG